MNEKMLETDEKLIELTDKLTAGDLTQELKWLLEDFYVVDVEQEKDNALRLRFPVSGNFIMEIREVE